jgi:hypothetical protein
VPRGEPAVADEIDDKTAASGFQPKTAFSRFPTVRGAGLEGRLRVEFTRSSNGPATPGFCAKRTAGIDAFLRTGTDRKVGPVCFVDQLSLKVHRP